MNLGILAALAGAVAVAAGAFGAHALKDRLDPSALATFETAARYHLVHALAAVFAVERAERTGDARARRAAVLFLVGVAVFGASLYGLALGGPRLLGAVAPLGGTAMIAGWLLLASSFRSR
jgi:uncharacterized membrane protein YgdD (TMEM256/DUF423 family)